MAIDSPRLLRRKPIAADARPLPTEETTPPVMKMNLLMVPFPGPAARRPGLLREGRNAPRVTPSR